MEHFEESLECFFNVLKSWLSKKWLWNNNNKSHLFDSIKNRLQKIRNTHNTHIVTTVQKSSHIQKSCLIIKLGDVRNESCWCISRTSLCYFLTLHHVLVVDTTWSVWNSLKLFPKYPVERGRFTMSAQSYYYSGLLMDVLYFAITQLEWMK